MAEAGVESISTTDQPDTDEYDLTQVDENIYSLWNSITAKPTVEDMEDNLQNGEDLPPMATRAEVIGWLIWDFSNGPQWQVFMALTWTIFLVQNATHYACDNNLPYGCDLNNNPINSDKGVTISLGGSQIKPESFYFIVVAFSGAIQLIAYVMIGGIHIFAHIHTHLHILSKYTKHPTKGLMDYGTYQFEIFRWCALIGALFDAPYIFLSEPGSFMFAGFWTAIGIVFYGLATIAYNSQLVDIVENHWIVRRAIRMGLNAEECGKVRALLVDDLSNFGVSGSYTGSLFMTIVAMLIFAVMAETIYTEHPNYGKNDGNLYEEMWAKKVYGAQINSFYFDGLNDTVNIANVQLFYDDIALNGTNFGNDIDDMPNDVNIQKDAFYAESGITKIMLWYNLDDTIRGIQFETADQTMSNVFGSVSSTAPEIVQSEQSGFLFAGYNVYIGTKDGDDDMQVIEGFDFLFLSPDGQFGSTLSIRVVVFSVFLFWFLLQLITLFTMQKRPKAGIPNGSSVWTISTKNTWHTLSETFVKYKHIRKALLAWFFYSDAIGTSMTASILFAQIELNFTFVELVLLLLEFEIFCAIGGVGHLWLQKKIGWDCRKMMLYHLTFYSILTCYVLLGVIPNIPFGMVQKWEMWILTMIYGMNAASLVGFGRSLTANMIPEGKENDMFSLFAITDKGSSWIGPAIMGVASNIVGIRWPLLYVLIFFLVSIPIISSIDIQEGLRQAGRFDDEEEDGKKKKDEKEEQTEKMIKLGGAKEMQPIVSMSPTAESEEIASYEDAPNEDEEHDEP